MAKGLLFVLGLALSVAACVWVAHQTDLASVSRELRAIGPGWVLWFLLPYAGGYVARAFRSRTMAMASGFAPSLWTAGAAVVVGCTANNLLPLRFGELVRTFYFSARTSVPRTTSLCLVLAERCADLLMLVIFLFLTLGLSSLTLGGLPPSLRSLLVPALGLFVGIAIISFLIQRLSRSPSRWFAKLPLRVQRLLEQLLLALRLFQDWRRMVQVLLVSALVWLCEGGLFVGIAFALELPHPILLGYLSLAVVSLSILVPSSPGYVGVFHAVVIFTLVPFGVSPDKALAFALISHGLPFITVTASGLIILLRDTTLLLGLLRSTRDPQNDHVPLPKNDL